MTTSKRWLALPIVAALFLTACPSGQIPPFDSCDYRPDPVVPDYSWSPSAPTTVPGRPGEFRSFVPSTPEGLVVLFDGGGGSRLWFDTVEGRLLVDALVAADYAVLGLNLDGQYAWNEVADYEQNALFVEQAIDEVRDPFGPDLPLFYIGFSKGGGFASLFHDTVQANAQILFNTSGHESGFVDPAFDTPPTMWILGTNDRKIDNPALVLDYAAELDARHVNHAVFYNEPTSPFELAFARIANSIDQVTWTDSRDAYLQMLSEDVIELDVDTGCPFVTEHWRRALSTAVITYGPSFTPTSPSTSPSPPVQGPTRFVPDPNFDRKAEVEAQIDELYGGHQITSDFKHTIVSFFDEHP
ncbi:MAG: hypothetical protein ACR2QK_18605 [Acidimicrobiales bacterium]